MAAPTITWRQWTGASPGSAATVTVLDYGNVQAGYWSDAVAITAQFSGNSANTLKFWLNDSVSTGGNTDVSNSNNWTHNYSIDATYQNPAGVTDNMKSGSVTDNNGNTWTQLPESEPGSSNFDNSTVTSGADTDYIYMGVQPPSNAGDGLTENWGYRLSFLYP